MATASHQIALNIAAVAFMVPLGVASAAAVRVGQAVGRRDSRGAASAGWTAMAIGAGFMATAAVVFLVMPRAADSLFYRRRGRAGDGRVSAVRSPPSSSYSTGCRATSPAPCAASATRLHGHVVVNLAGHWVVGLPLGYLLCFLPWGLGVVGLWWGLSIGLIVAGAVLTAVWARRVAR